MLVLPVSLAAATRLVDFNAALTNEAGWTYSEGVNCNSSGLYYVKKAPALVTSPQFDFAITSMTIRVHTTGSCTRNLIVTPIRHGLPLAHHAREFTGILQNADSELSVAWPIADQADGVELKSTKGAQNLYLLSAAISGVRHVAAPTNLHADGIYGRSLTISWTNPEEAVGNIVYTSRIRTYPRQGTTEAEYDFSQFSNQSGNPMEITADFTSEIPSFSGSSLVYLPARSAAAIQISRDSEKGYLVHRGFSDCSNMSVIVSCRVPTDEHGKTFGIGYVSATGTTNEFAAFSMSTSYTTNAVSATGVPDGAPIIFNTQGSASKRVVRIDYIAFIRDYIPARTTTNAVPAVYTAASPATVQGLKPDSLYTIYVTAVDSEGNESPPSERVEIQTSSRELPFTIRLL